MDRFAGYFYKPSYYFFGFSLFLVKVIQEYILPAQYEHVVGDDLINLAVVLEDMATSERVLASEEFNIASSGLTIQVLIIFPSNILAF